MDDLLRYLKGAGGIDLGTIKSDKINDLNKEVARIEATTRKLLLLHFVIRLIKGKR